MIDCLTTHWIFYACIIFASVLSIIPLVGKFLNVLNTLFHESGHAVVALLTGGGVMNIKLSADTSGAAQTKSKYWLGKFLTSLAGYPISSLAAWFFFWMLQQHKVSYIFYTILTTIFINLILWVRNTFGIIWLIFMGSTCTLVYIYAKHEYQFYFAAFCAGILLFQSIYSAITLLFISFKNPSKSGDAKNLQDFTFIPAFIWSFLFLIGSLYVAYKSFLLMPCMANLSKSTTAFFS